MVACQQAELCAWLQDHQDAAIDHHVDIRAHQIDELQRMLHNHIARYVNEDAILHESGIEGSDAISMHICQFAIVRTYQILITQRKLFETTHKYPFWK